MTGCNRHHRGAAAAIVSLGLVGLLQGASPVGATCGSATCFLIDGTTDGLLEAGSFQLDVSYSYVDQSRLRKGSDEVDHVVTPRVDLEHGEVVPLQHREVRTQNMKLEVGAQYGVTSRLQLQVKLPLVVVREHQHFDAVEPADAHEVDAHRAVRSAVLPVRAHGPAEYEFNNQDGTLGIGDLQLGGRYGVVVTASDLVTVGAMVKLRTGPHDLLDHHGAINEPSLQPGSGSTDLGLSLDWSRRLGSEHEFELFASGGYWLRGQSEFDYAIGDELSLGLGLRVRAGEKWRPSLQLNWRGAARDTLGGDEVPSTGSRELALTPGVLFGVSEGATLYAHVQIPLQQHVNEEQLARGVALILGVNRKW